MPRDKTIYQWWDYFSCNSDTDSSFSGLTARICIKPYSLDKVVSNSIRKFGAWELNYVNTIIKMIEKFPKATFLGSN